MRQVSGSFRRVPKPIQLCAVLVGLGVLVSSGQVGAQAPAAAKAAGRKTLKVLFVGNSYTFNGNMPDLVAGIAKAKKDGPLIEPTLATSPNKDLAWHIANDAYPAIDKGGWDIVNIQETSLLPGGKQDGNKWIIGDPAKTPGGYFESVREIVKHVRAVKATPMLEATWARRDNPGTMSQDVLKAVEQIAQELNIKVAPVGTAWEEARWQLRPMEFHFRDGSHPNQTGFYLTACVMYATLTGKSPVGAPAMIMGHATNPDGSVNKDKMVALADLGQGTANTLQRIAWDVVTAYHHPAQTASLATSR